MATMEEIGAALFVDEDEVFHDAATKPMEPTDVLLSSIRDGIVADSTRNCFTSKFFSIIFWLKNNQHHVLTQHGTFMIDSKIELYPELNPKQLYKRFCDRFLEELRDGNTQKKLKIFLLLTLTWTSYGDSAI
jgi:hypothetical protein